MATEKIIALMRYSEEKQTDGLTDFCLTSLPRTLLLFEESPI